MKQATITLSLVTKIFVFGLSLVIFGTGVINSAKASSCAVPGNQQVIKNDNDFSQTKLQWDRVLNAVGYEVKITFSDGTVKNVTITGGDNNYYIFNQFLPCGDFTWQVRSICCSQCGDCGNKNCLDYLAIYPSQPACMCAPGTDVYFNGNNWNVDGNDDPLNFNLKKDIGGNLIGCSWNCAENSPTSLISIESCGRDYKIECGAQPNSDGKGPGNLVITTYPEPNGKGYPYGTPPLNGWYNMCTINDLTKLIWDNRSANPSTWTIDNTYAPDDPIKSLDGRKWEWTCDTKNCEAYVPAKCGKKHKQTFPANPGLTEFSDGLCDPSQDVKNFREKKIDGKPVGWQWDCVGLTSQYFKDDANENYEVGSPLGPLMLTKRNESCEATMQGCGWGSGNQYTEAAYDEFSVTQKDLSFFCSGPDLVADIPLNIIQSGGQITAWEWNCLYDDGSLITGCRADTTRCASPANGYSYSNNEMDDMILNEDNAQNDADKKFCHHGDRYIESGALSCVNDDNGNGLEECAWQCHGDAYANYEIDSVDCQMELEGCGIADNMWFDANDFNSRLGETGFLCDQGISLLTVQVSSLTNGMWHWDCGGTACTAYAQGTCKSPNSSDIIGDATWKSDSWHIYNQSDSAYTKSSLIGLADNKLCDVGRVENSSGSANRIICAGDQYGEDLADNTCKWKCLGNNPDPNVTDDDVWCTTYRKSECVSGTRTYPNDGYSANARSRSYGPNFTEAGIRALVPPDSGLCRWGSLVDSGDPQLTYYDLVGPYQYANEGGEYGWICAGADSAYNNDDVNCRLDAESECGVANGGQYSEEPPVGERCLKGYPSEWPSYWPDTTLGKWKWSCVNELSQSVVNCEAKLKPSCNKKTLEEYKDPQGLNKEEIWAMTEAQLCSMGKVRRDPNNGDKYWVDCDAGTDKCTWICDATYDGAKPQDGVMCSVLENDCLRAPNQHRFNKAWFLREYSDNDPLSQRPQYLDCTNLTNTGGYCEINYDDWGPSNLMYVYAQFCKYADNPNTAYRSKLVDDRVYYNGDTFTWTCTHQSLNYNCETESGTACGEKSDGQQFGSIKDFDDYYGCFDASWGYHSYGWNGTRWTVDFDDRCHNYESNDDYRLCEPGYVIRYNDDPGRKADGYSLSWNPGTGLITWVCWEVTNNSLRTPEVCAATIAICGDGKRQGNEECDDGNDRINDGCDRECHIECGPDDGGKFFPWIDADGNKFNKPRYKNNGDVNYNGTADYRCYDGYYAENFPNTPNNNIWTWKCCKVDSSGQEHCTADECNARYVECGEDDNGKAFPANNGLYNEPRFPGNLDLWTGADMRCGADYAFKSKGYWPTPPTNNRWDWNCCYDFNSDGQYDNWECRDDCYAVKQNCDIAGSIAKSQKICANYTPAGLTGTAPADTDTTLRWQKNDTANCDNEDNPDDWQNIDGATSQNYSPPALSATTCYRRVANKEGCGDKPTSALKITITNRVDQNADLKATDNSGKEIVAGQTVCAGSQLTYTATTNTDCSNPTYSWTGCDAGTINGNICKKTRSNIGTYTGDVSVTIVCDGGCYLDASLESKEIKVDDVEDPTSVTIKPTTLNVCASKNESQLFEATPNFSSNIPDCSDVKYVWRVDNVVQNGNANTFDAKPLSLTSGSHTISVTAQCQSPCSDKTVTPAVSATITVANTKAGAIAIAPEDQNDDGDAEGCAPFDPRTFVSTVNASDYETLDWEYSEDSDGNGTCDTAWKSLVVSTQTYNAPGLSKTTCYHRVVYSDACDLLTTNDIKVKTNPRAVANAGNLLITPPSWVCSGTQTELSLENNSCSEGPMKIEWYENNAYENNALFNTNPFTKTNIDADSDFYSYKAKVTCGVTCQGEDESEAVPLEVKPRPHAMPGSMSINPENPACSGTEFTLSLPSGSCSGGFSPTIEWYEVDLSDNIPNKIGEGNNLKHTKNVSRQTELSYYAKMTCGTDCTETNDSTTKNIVINPRSVANAGTITASQNPVCSGATSALSFSVEPSCSDGEPTIKWHEVDSNTSLGSGLSLNITKTVTTQTTFRYVADVTCGDTCPDTKTTNQIDLVVNPSKTWTMTNISGDNDYCSGLTKSYSATIGNCSNPQTTWTLRLRSDNSVVASGTSTSVNPTYPAPNDLSPGDYTISFVSRCTDEPGCNLPSEISKSKDFTVIEQARVNNAGTVNVNPTPICSGSSSSLSLSGHECSGNFTPTINWYENNSANIFGTGTPLSVNKNVSASTVFTYKAKITCGTVCKETKDANGTASLTVNPNKTWTMANVSGDNDYCSGNAKTYSTTVSNCSNPTSSWTLTNRADGSEVGSGSGLSYSALANLSAGNYTISFTADCHLDACASPASITKSKNFTVKQTYEVPQATTPASAQACSAANLSVKADLSYSSNLPDCEGDSLSYAWFVDNTRDTSQTTDTFNKNNLSIGSHSLRVEVTCAKDCYNGTNPTTASTSINIYNCACGSADDKNFIDNDNNDVIDNLGTFQYCNSGCTAELNPPAFNNSTGDWEWVCKCGNGLTGQSCNAGKTVCGDAKDQTFVDASWTAANRPALCAKGSASPSAPVAIDKLNTDEPDGNSCNGGGASTGIKDTWEWRCADSVGSQTPTCSAKRLDCGVADASRVLAKNCTIQPYDSSAGYHGSYLVADSVPAGHKCNLGATYINNWADTERGKWYWRCEDSLGRYEECSARKDCGWAGRSSDGTRFTTVDYGDNGCWTAENVGLIDNNNATAVNWGQAMRIKMSVDDNPCNNNGPTWYQCKSLHCYSYLNNACNITGICPDSDSYELPTDEQWSSLEESLANGNNCNADRFNSYDCDPAGASNQAGYTNDGLRDGVTFNALSGGSYWSRTSTYNNAPLCGGDNTCRCPFTPFTRDFNNSNDISRYAATNNCSTTNYPTRNVRCILPAGARGIINGGGNGGLSCLGFGCFQ